MSILRIAGLVNNSIVDGPGLRFTIFTQGCPHNCPGCHNPVTHSFKGGKKLTSGNIIKQIYSSTLLYGVTFSGGEPLMQAKALLPIAKKIKDKGLELACYTGFIFEELVNSKDKHIKELLPFIDILIDGKFVQNQKSLNLKYKGSKNQRTLDLPASLKLGKAVISNSPLWNK